MEQKVELDSLLEDKTKDITKDKPKIEDKLTIEDKTKIKSEDDLVATQSFKNEIITKIIQPGYVKDIKDTLKWRYRWRKIGNISHMCGKVLTLSGAAVAFSAGFITTPAAAFVSGCISLSGILCIQYGDYAYTESSRETEDANKILQTLGIDGVPELTDDLKPQARQMDERLIDKENTNIKNYAPVIVEA